MNIIDCIVHVIMNIVECLLTRLFIPPRHYSHVDCPGHPDYTDNPVNGLSRMDWCILVVALTDGPMPQTREHLILASTLGMKVYTLYNYKTQNVFHNGFSS